MSLLHCAVAEETPHSSLNILSSQYPNISKWLLSPLNVKVPVEIEGKIMLLREAVLDEGYDLPEEDRQAHIHAVKLCESLSHGFTERRKKQVAASLRIAQRTSYTPLHNQALDARRNYLMSWPQYEREVQQRLVLLQYRNDANMVASKKAEQEWLTKSLRLQKNASRHYRQMRHKMRESGNKNEPAKIAENSSPSPAVEIDGRATEKDVKPPTSQGILHTFGNGDDVFTMEFVLVGNPGNKEDATGHGAVSYNYLIGKYEVNRSKVWVHNRQTGGPKIYTRNRTAGHPANFVTWNEAARFVNWLNTSQGYPPAYKFITEEPNDNIALWTAGESGYDASSPYRNSGARYFLPNEDEWYKAAFYDPKANGGKGGYWDYATGSEEDPEAVAHGTKAGTTVSHWKRSKKSGPAHFSEAGGLSPYGTMAQGGNVSEWIEDAFDESNDSATEPRLVRGGWWGRGYDELRSSFRLAWNVDGEHHGIGFRVAAKP